VTTQRLWSSLAALLFTPVIPALAADKDAPGEPLPKGAKARLGTTRTYVGTRGLFGPQLLPPDYRTILVGGGALDRPRLRDVVTGKVTDVPGFEPPGRFARTRGLTIAAVSADGKRAVTEKDHGSYLVFEIATGKELATAPRDVFAGGVALSADGKVLALDVAGKDRVREAIVWDVERNAQLARVPTLKSPFPIPKLLSPDGKILAVFGAQDMRSTVQFWDVATSKLIAANSDEATGGAAAFSPDGKTLALASEGAIQLWEATTGKAGPLLLGRSDGLQRLAFSPDGKTLAAVTNNWKIERWALPEGKPLKSMPFPLPDVAPIYGLAWVLGMGFADNERIVAFGELWGLAVVWEAPSGKLLTPPTGHLSAVSAVRFTADGKEVVTTGADRRVLRWETATGKRTGSIVAQPHQQFPFDNFNSAPYTRLGPGATRGVRYNSLFDVATGEELFSLPVSTLSDDFRRAAGYRFPTRPNTPSRCEVWDLEGRRRVAQLEAPSGFARDTALAFSPDNSRLVVVGSVVDPALAGRWALLVTGWDVSTGKRLGEVREPLQRPGGGRDEDRPHLAAAGNNSGVVLATPDGKLWVADYERGTRGETLAEITKPLQRFTHPTFGPDAKVFAVGAPSENPDAFDVRVYDWPHGRLLRTFTGHRGAITALCFSPDGKTLASGSADSTVLLWDMSAVSAPK
jgi:WD40 repeat protein